MIDLIKKKKIKGEPKKVIESIIENFKFDTPKSLPPICSLISGYFSYDTIRYLEKIPNKCKDDLNLPDVRILRPKTLIIHDNYKKKIFFIVNIFKDEKINDYKKKYNEIKNELFMLNIISKHKAGSYKKKSENKLFVKSNTSKKKIFINSKQSQKIYKNW